MKFTVALHSVIDLITNSSTEMFMDFSGSIEPIKDLVNEFLKINGSDKTCDDVFNLTIVPSWAEDDPDEWEEYNPSSVHVSLYSTVLHIETKDPEFEQLGNLIRNLLDSVESSEYMC